ncbi:hypothetical protein GN956_G13574 [Arapaima gigas]
MRRCRYSALRWRGGPASTYILAFKHLLKHWMQEATRISRTARRKVRLHAAARRPAASTFIHLLSQDKVLLSLLELIQGSGRHGQLRALG